MAEYPKRGSHFAHRTFRVMTKVCAAQDIGSDAMLLVTVILHVEDAKRYSGAVSFYNGQLMPILGFKSWGSLDKARKSAINAGWLHYESRGKRKAGLYWGMVPEQYKDLDDSPVDEGDYHHFIDESGGNTGDKVEVKGSIITTLPPQVEIETGLRRDRDVIETRQCGEPPILSPNPNPNPKKTGTGKVGVLSLVSLEILADPKRVLDWFKQASTGKGKVLEPTEGNKINIIALAQRVLRDPKVCDPVKVFVANVRDLNFKVTNVEEDRAVAAIKLIERGPPSKQTSYLSRKNKSKEQQLREAREHMDKIGEKYGTDIGGSLPGEELN